MAKKIDLTGQKFGRLTVIAVSGHLEGRKKKTRAWLCQCGCGNTVIAGTNELTSGNTASCGCGRVIDETGKKYGRLTVIRWVQDFDGQGACWLCRCDCGKEIITRGSSLRDGGSTSCGCLATEKLRAAVMLPEGIAARNQVINKTRRSGLARGYAWELSDEQALAIIQQPCCYCGSPPSQVSRHPELNGSFTYNGIDRLDNKQGYTPKNVVPCCKHCNYAKRDRSMPEFLEWVVQVYRYSVLKER